MDNKLEKIAVIATADGFYGGARRRKGSTFFVKAGTTGKWFVPTDPDLAAIHADAIEQANKTKAEATKAANQAIFDAEQKLKETRLGASKIILDAKQMADATTKKTLFGSLMGDRESKPVVEKADGSDLA